MAIISFAKTGAQFMSGKKTCTRRDWSDRQFKMWCNFWNTGRLIHDAYDKSPRNGGKCIGEIRLTRIPCRERLCDMLDWDLEEEGGMCDTVEEFCKFISMKPEDWVTVIRFEKI